jgi:sec-independent protein translocase protein TatA
MFRNPYADTLVVLLIVLLILGPKRLPMLGRSLGQGLREFKDSITGGSSDDDHEEDRPELTKASAPAAETPAAGAAATPASSPADHAG